MTTMMDVYDRLYSHYGPQQWWPGETALEIMVGAILVQNTAWKNVEKAITNLKEQGLLDPQALHACHLEELAETIRSAGYYRLKAKRLKNLITFLIEEFDGDLDQMFATDTTTLREQLLAINGIGPETADSILLYAANKRVFVVDTYTARVLKRHGWIWAEADYYQIQDHFVSELPQEIELYNEYHALLVSVGHHHCRKTPKCEECPLADLLPGGQIVDFE